MHFFFKGGLPLLVAAMAFAPALSAQEAEAQVTPSGVVANAPATDWHRIDPADLMVMDLSPDARGKRRRVVIQLIPAPFSQGWVDNIRKLIASHWYDGIAVVRVQDNYVVQWGDPDGETDHPKPLPEGLEQVPQSQYVAASAPPFGPPLFAPDPQHNPLRPLEPLLLPDAYAPGTYFAQGWPLATDAKGVSWPVHCYGYVGVGRNYSPDTGTGAELYTVIGQAPRQLDRNIAVVGRIIAGMEYLSSLPRGTGEMGFYETPQERTKIASVRFGSQVPDLPAYEAMATDSDSFANYAYLRANRHDTFYNVPAGGVDVCNVPVPVRQVGLAVKRAGM
ncbi:peptidylprolyl isomerase [Novosphingobium decolorationis]|uniref:peptidylprolyl isomerase n=1 Tax=Novosphingobium decolorationis TaxID=2698673 RepID=A0ABX8E7L2_9SPHN|nr:peptidylprolyl isomerase [Novosphingobium decolorationis]QVM85167.1 peptidylprolyl isomerase [Novosphingobium decolorationis]